MTDQELTGHFQEISTQFVAMNRRFDTMDQQFGAMNHEFRAMGRQLGETNARLDGLDKQVGETNARLERVEVTVRRLDVEVHRQGILADERHRELGLATESFQTLQRVTTAKIDGLREAIDLRLVPLEVTVRTHSDDIARHTRQIEGRRE
jgi:archaellum component FlaC